MSANSERPEHARSSPGRAPVRQFPPPAVLAETVAARSAAGHDWVREQGRAGEPTARTTASPASRPRFWTRSCQTNGNRVAAARRLGLARATLRKLIALYRTAEDAGDETEE